MDLKQIVIKETSANSFFERCRELKHRPDFDESTHYERSYAFIENPLIYTGNQRFENCIYDASSQHWLRMTAKNCKTWYRLYKSDYYHVSDKSDLLEKMVVCAKNNVNSRNFFEITFYDNFDLRHKHRKVKVSFADFPHEGKLIGVEIVAGFRGLELLTNHVLNPKYRTLAIWEG